MKESKSTNPNQTLPDISMPRPPASDSSLSIHRAFVIQFRGEIDEEEGHFAGRIEHVASKKACTFHSWGEMQAFVRDVLRQVRTNRSETP